MPASFKAIEKERFPFLAFIDTVGDGTGVNDFAVNFTEPTIYKRVVPENFTLCVTGIVVNFIGQGGISPEGFGGGAALINGMAMAFVLNGVSLQVGEIEFIKTNYELSLTTTLALITEFTGNDKGFRAELDIKKLGIDCLKINGDNGDMFKTTFDDDYTSRISIGQIGLEGYLESNS